MSEPRTLRLPFKDELVLAIAAGEKLETRRLSPPKAQAGDVMAVCEALIPVLAAVPGLDTYGDCIGFRADGAVVRRGVFGIPWPWRGASLSARYFPTLRIPEVLRHRRLLIEVRREPLSAITDQGARDEGIARLGWDPTREGFLRGFLPMHELPPDADPLVTVYRWSPSSLVRAALEGA